MRKILALFLCCMSFINAYAISINKIIFFGDSLSDNGRLYSLLFNIIPKSPPYFNGRFSNGPTWAEEVGNYYYKKNFVEYKVYAMGGATAVYRMPSTKFITLMTLGIEVDEYLVDSILEDRSNSLFSIWIGGNDYLFTQFTNAESITNEVVNTIANSINKLIFMGGENFLVLNLPDLGIAPQVKDYDLKNRLHDATIMHNKKLAEAVEKIQDENPTVHITLINLYDLFNDLIREPAKYNKKYNINITNTSDACWQGGFFFADKLSDYGLENEIQQTVLNSSTTLPKHFDSKIMSSYILNTPELAYAYHMSKAYEHGYKPCNNPNEFLFWDAIHPSAVAHQVLSQIVIENLNTQIA